jgi:hypothetical protein
MCIMRADQRSSTVAGRTRLLSTVSVPVFAPIFAAERVMMTGYLTRSTYLDLVMDVSRLIAFSLGVSQTVTVNIYSEEHIVKAID